MTSIKPKPPIKRLYALTDADARWLKRYDYPSVKNAMKQPIDMLTPDELSFLANEIDMKSVEDAAKFSAFWKKLEALTAKGVSRRIWPFN